MKLKLHWQILIALVLAVIVGLLTGKSGVPLSVKSYVVLSESCHCETRTYHTPGPNSRAILAGPY